jgi:hypothetical protein
MLHHVVLYRLLPGITLERVRLAREALAALAERMPGVMHFSVTDNLAQDNRGYTLALFAAFEGKEAYEIFGRDPEVRHVMKELIDTIVEKKIVALGQG